MCSSVSVVAFVLVNCALDYDGDSVCKCVYVYLVMCVSNDV